MHDPSHGLLSNRGQVWLQSTRSRLTLSWPMKINDPLKERLAAWFLPLDGIQPQEVFPLPASLSATLAGLLPNNVPATVVAPANLTTHFMTAAVEIWLRSIHSFLVSAALTKA